MEQDIISNLKQCSYYNSPDFSTKDKYAIPFVFLEVTEEFGKRVAIHEFINSDSIIAQDLGADKTTYKLRVIFSIDGIHTDTNFQNNILIEHLITNKYTYFQKREKLIRELMKTGHGILMHPVEGLLRVQFIKGRIVEGIASLGFPDLEIEFVKVQTRNIDNIIDFTIKNTELIFRDTSPLPEEKMIKNVNGDIVPEIELITKNDTIAEPIKQDSLLTRFRKSIVKGAKATGKFIAKSYNTSVSALKATKETVDKTLDKITKVQNKFAQISTAAANFSDTVNGFKDNLNNILISPFLLANNLISTLNTVKDTISNPFDQFNAFMEIASNNSRYGVLLGFASSNNASNNPSTENGLSTKSIKLIPQTEEERLIKQTQNAIEDLVTAYSLAAACSSLLDYNFINVGEVTSVKQKINAFFNVIFSSTIDVVSQSSEYYVDDRMDNILLDYLQQISEAINKYFDGLILTLPTIQVINFRENDINSILYGFYNNLDYKEYLLELNKNLYDNPRFISGNLKMIVKSV